MISKNIRATSNLAMLEFTATKLGNLLDKFIFLGGCTTALFITDIAAPDIRPTIDVDCIVDVISLNQYHQLAKQLRILGFKESSDSKIICRWHYDDITLDVMPTDERILGFSNRWYPEAIQHAVNHQLSNKIAIKSVTAPYFLAIKLEAFKNRGKNDFLASHDLEDIITIIDGRIELIDEIMTADNLLKQYLAKAFSNLIKNTRFETALPGYLNYGTITKNRMQIVWERIKQISTLH